MRLMVLNVEVNRRESDELVEAYNKYLKTKKERCSDSIVNGED